MGSQTAILGTTDDIAALLAAAAARGARAVPEFVTADEPPGLSNPEELFRRQPQDKLFLLPGDLAAVEIFTIPGSNPAIERVNERTSPVVEVVPTRTSGKSLRAGRIYLGTERSGEFFRFAKQLYDVLRKASAGWSLAQPGKVRVGPQAVALAAQGGCVLESRIGERIKLVEGGAE